MSHCNRATVFALLARALLVASQAASYPPAPPPKSFPPLISEYGDQFSIGGILGLTFGGLFLVVISAIGVLVAMKAPLDSGPVPQAKLAKLTFNVGYSVTMARVPIAAVVLVTYAIISGVGWTQYEYSNELYNWVPIGGRFESQLREWDRLVNNSVTDRTAAYILVQSDNDDENLLSDPKRWLNATLETVKRVYTAANITALDKYGKTLTLSWKDFCFSVNHPILTKPVLGGLVSNGTGTDFKPCINPSVLDPFREHYWEFDPSDGDPVKIEKARSFQSINQIAEFACTRIDDDYCGQINNPLQYDSFFELSREQIIEKLMSNGATTGHWVHAASQPWGKLYGSLQGSIGGTRELTYAKSFMYTLYQDVSHRRSARRHSAAVPRWQARVARARSRLADVVLTSPPRLRPPLADPCGGCQG